MTRSNELTWTLSNDPHEQIYMGDYMTQTKRQGQAGQTSYKNVQKANLGSKLGIFDWAHLPVPTVARMTRLNELTRTPSNDLPEQSDKGELGKRATQTCTNPTSGHKLAFLILAHSPGCALAQTTRPNELTRTPSNDPPERIYMGACMTETKPQGRAKQTSSTNMHKANPGSQLSIFYTGSFSHMRPRQNDPPERANMDALKLPARTILHGRPYDRNEGTRENQANELHECGQIQPRVTN